MKGEEEGEGRDPDCAPFKGGGEKKRVRKSPFMKEELLKSPHRSLAFRHYNS